MRQIIPFLLAGAFLADPLLASDNGVSHAQAEILPGWRTEAGTHMAALHVTLDPGWKTYWRAPGEAGLPPEFDWSKSLNAAEVIVHWPTPEVFLSSGVRTLGFHDDLVLPLEIVPEDPAAAIELSGDLALGICENICMPMQVSVSAELPDSETRADPRIEFALDHRPESAQAAGLVSARCDVEPISDGLRVTAQLELPDVGDDEVVVVETADPSVWVSTALSDRSGAVLTAEADLVPANAQPFALDPEDLRFTVLASGRAVDIHGCEASH